MKETAGNLVHEVDVEESLGYLEDVGYDTEGLQEAARAVLVEEPEAAGGDIQLRYLKAGEDTAFEKIKLEEPGNYGELLE